MTDKSPRTWPQLSYLAPYDLVLNAIADEALNMNDFRERLAFENERFGHANLEAEQRAWQRLRAEWKAGLRDNPYWGTGPIRPDWS